MRNIWNCAITWVADQVLAFLQRRCDHPGNMVAADVLEGCFPELEVKYCRRCGAIKTDWKPRVAKGHVIAIPHYWRSPDPNLWRDYRSWWQRLRAELRDVLDGLRRDGALPLAVLLVAALALTACGTHKAPQGPAQPTAAPIVIPPVVVDAVACAACGLIQNAAARAECQAIACPALPEPRPRPQETATVASPQPATPSPSPTAPTEAPTVAATPSPTSLWTTRLLRVNGFAGCNPDGGPGRTACHGDRTFWFTMPGFDILARDVNCEISCARRPGDTNCINACNRNDSPGTPCGGAPSCDSDHLSCERVRIGCNGHSWDDPRGSVLKATGDGFDCEDGPSCRAACQAEQDETKRTACVEDCDHRYRDNYGFNCTGTPGGSYTICARPFADPHTEDGTPILVQGTGEWCAAGKF